MAGPPITAQVAAYLASPEFRAAVSRRSGRGIVMNAGGSRVLTSAVITLHVLRHHLRCQLPIELVWDGPDEMDASTLASLEREFKPLRGYSLAGMKSPAHHR